jgi:hypothetical protein
MNDEDPIVFGNRKYLFNSGSEKIISGYATIISPKMDCSYEAPFIYVNTGATTPESLTYDLYSGSGYNLYVSYPLNPGSVMSSAGIVFTGNYNIFRNGYFLVSGRDYFINSSFEFVLNPSPNFNNNAYYFIKESPDLIYVSGSISSANSSVTIVNKYFNNGITNVYSSGLRLIKNIDYFESSTTDLLTGTFRVPAFNNKL